MAPISRRGFFKTAVALGTLPLTVEAITNKQTLKLN